MRGATRGESHIRKRRQFQLTHLLRGATRPSRRHRCRNPRFQLTHLLRGATPAIMDIPPMKWISTHAPLARCDGGTLRIFAAGSISTHAPLARCDVCTPRPEHHGADFNSRTSCEVRLMATVARGVHCDFNSRTSCEVRRCTADDYMDDVKDFNSRTSCEVRQSGN